MKNAIYYLETQVSASVDCSFSCCRRSACPASLSAVGRGREEKMSRVQWAGICLCAWVTSVTGFCSSWLPCRKTSIAPTRASSLFGYTCSSSSSKHDRRTTRQGRQYQTVAGKRLTLACSLDDLRTVQRDNGGVVGDVAFEDGEVCGW